MKIEGISGAIARSPRRARPRPLAEAAPVRITPEAGRISGLRLVKITVASRPSGQKRQHDADATRRLGNESTAKLLFEFSLPAIAGMIVQSLYAIIDRAFIGNSAGTLAIAGITVCIPLMTIFMALGMLIGMGGASLLSIRLGQEKHDEARRVLGNTFLLLILSSVPLCAITGLLLTPMLRLFGASTGSLPYAAAYMSLILVGIPFQMVGFGMNNFIRAIGRPGLAMTTMLIGALLNAALAPLFIFVLSWGIRGAAFATIIAQAVSCLFVMAFFSAPYGPFRIRRSDLALRAPVVRGIVSIGLAPFFMQVGACLVASAFNRQLTGYGGDAAVSVYGIVHGVTALALMPVIGISQGAQPIIGFNYGAGNAGRVKSTLRGAIASGTIIIAAALSLALFSPETVIRFFNPCDERLCRMGAEALRTFLAMLPLAAFQVCACAYFQAVGKPGLSILLTLTRQIAVLLPCLFILPRFFGLTGVWLSGPVSDLAVFIVTAVLLAGEMRRFRPVSFS